MRNTPGPRLQDLLTKKIVYFDDRSQAYVGRASDGVEVQIGSIGEELTIENYLNEHPGPESW